MIVMDTDDPANTGGAERHHQNPVPGIRADRLTAGNDLGDPPPGHRALENAELDAVETEVLQVLDQSQAGVIVTDIVQNHHDNIGHRRHLPSLTGTGTPGTRVRRSRTLRSTWPAAR